MIPWAHYIDAGLDAPSAVAGLQPFAVATVEDAVDALAAAADRAQLPVAHLQDDVVLLRLDDFLGIVRLALRDPVA